MKHKILKVLCAFLAFLPATVPANAQASIWNALSTSSAAQSPNRVQINFPRHSDLYRKNDFQAYGSRSLRGFGRSTEIGFDTFYTKAVGIVRAGEVSARAGKTIYATEKYGFQWLIRSALFMPVSHRGQINAPETIYDAIRKKIAAKFSRRPASGGFNLAGRENEIAPRPGFRPAKDKTASALSSGLYAAYRANNGGLADDYPTVSGSYTF